MRHVLLVAGSGSMGVSSPTRNLLNDSGEMFLVRRPSEGVPGLLSGNGHADGVMGRPHEREEEGRSESRLANLRQRKRFHGESASSAQLDERRCSKEEADAMRRVANLAISVAVGIGLTYRALGSVVMNDS